MSDQQFSSPSSTATNFVVEDEVRLVIVRELSYLFWSLTRSCAPLCEIPLALAESRIYFLGRWLGKDVPDEINFGMQLSRLLVPLVLAPSSLVDDEPSATATASASTVSVGATSLHGYHLLEEELIVSFLQNAVRLTTNWKAEECLKVTAFCPRSLQVLATLCGHRSSVIRLLASMMLRKLTKAHPVIEQCAASQLNMFLHFVVDAAKMEFKAQFACN